MTDARRRAHMVDDQLVRRGLRDPDLLAAMRLVPRHRFVPAEVAAHVYADAPVSIGRGQFMGDAWSTALAIRAAVVRPGDTVLEVGTGSGYQAAVLAVLGARVTSLELDLELADRARVTLDALGYRVDVRCANGRSGWPPGAPWQRVVVGGAVERIEPAWLEQVDLGGRIVAPVGSMRAQELVCLERTATGWSRHRVGSVRFDLLG